MMQNSQVPGRNPLKYCRLCLSQENDLKVLASARSVLQPEKDLLQKLFHYTRITFNNKEDYPCAVCCICIEKFNEFHNFRRTLFRNHHAVRAYRQLYGDDLEEPEPEEDNPLVELAEEPMLTEIKQERVDENEDSGHYAPQLPEVKQEKETVKEVDVYHLDGELKTVVVKEEKLSPVRSPPVAASKNVNENAKKEVSPRINILNKNAAIVKRPQATVLNSEHSEKRVKMVSGHGFTVVKCSQCRAVFRNRENLLIHKRNDHPVQTISPKTVSTTQPAGSSKPSPHTQQVTLYRCPHCKSSFIHQDNFNAHQKICKMQSLAKRLNPQITVKRAVAPVVSDVRVAIAQVGGQVKIKQVFRKEESEDERIRCNYCPLTYKTKHFLKKHMLDTHKIDDYEDVFYCHVCKLNYSCNEDLQLHNRAIHRFQCKQCLEDFRTCLHSQVDIENDANKGSKD